MKNLLKVFFVALFVFVLAGCGNSKNTVTCTAKMNEEGFEATGEVVAEFDSADKLVDATAAYIFNDSTTASTYCSLFKLFEDESKEITVECNDKKVLIKGFAKLDSEDEEDSMIGLYKDDFIKLMKENEDGEFTCK